MKEDTQHNVGKILTGTFGRDAIHIAVAPVVADILLYPGDPIGLTDTGTARSGIVAIGIVDPFLTQPVHPGEQFFMFLYPNTITSLRHEWTHPAFSAHSEKAHSEKWLRNFANEYRIPYEDLLAETAAGHVIFGDDDGQEAMRDPELRAEFWGHYEAVTGTRVDAATRENTSFRCAC